MLKPTDLEELMTTMLALGFTKKLSSSEWGTLNSELDASEMSRSGPYRIYYVLVRGETEVTVEQNVGSQSAGDIQMAVTYPPVAKAKGPKGSVACALSDLELLKRIIDEVS